MLSLIITEDLLRPSHVKSCQTIVSDTCSFRHALHSMISESNEWTSPNWLLLELESHLINPCWPTDDPPPTPACPHILPESSLSCLNGQQENFNNICSFSFEKIKSQKREIQTQNGFVDELSSFFMFYNCLRLFSPTRYLTLPQCSAQKKILLPPAFAKRAFPCEHIHIHIHIHTSCKGFTY